MSYVIIDGKKTDIGIFCEELSKESEDRTDNLLFIMEINRLAKKERARRIAQKRVDESTAKLLEVFK